MERDLDRRGFFRRIAAAVGGVFAAVFGLPAAATVLDPALRGAAGAWHPAGPLDALREGEARRFKVPVAAGWETRHEVGFLVREGGEVTAFRARCTHLGCTVRFDAGEGLFLCPCHGGAFSLAGAPLRKPVTEPLARLETRIVDGRVEVRL